MRVADASVGHGVDHAMLDHIMTEARTLGVQKLWLETG